MFNFVNFVGSFKTGANNLDSGVGLYACDPEAYTVFQPLFDAVIKMYHKVDKVEHPTPTFGDLENLGFGDLDPEGNMIVSTRVRVGRSHDGFSFPPCSNKEVGLCHEFMRGKCP
jgi:creatine kinase